MISATDPDWSREQKGSFQWNPGRSLLASIRSYQKGGWLARKVAVVRHRFWSAITGAEIPLNCRIGGGLQIPHPNGIVIHPHAVVGPNCAIFQQVTIGTRVGEAVPTIGGHVEIGAGAKLLGGIHVGDHAVIGANAVVLCDVPDGALAVGVPAVISRGASLERQ